VDISTTGGITAFSSQESNVSFDTSIFIPPIVLDLNQDGILNYSQSIMDVNEDGQLDQTAWAGKEEGVLMWDKYADGQVHDNSQYAFAQYGGKTDLSGLAAAFDTNHDGKFNAQDAKFDEFAVWQDANQNGISDAGEVYKLSDIGMISLNLNTDNVLRQPATGVTEFGQTSAQLTNGSSMLIADAAFAYTTIKLDDVLQSPASNVTPLIVNGESLDVSPFVDTHYQAASFYDVKTAQLMDDLVNQSM
jgi:cytochrome b involved in lipid metabolism